MSDEKKVYETGRDIWQHGDLMRTYGHDGEPFHRYLGPCPDCGCRTFDYGGGWRCVGLTCARGTTNPASTVGEAPWWWNTPVSVAEKGAEWEATATPEYLDMLYRPVALGRSPQEAVDKLLRYVRSLKRPFSTAADVIGPSSPVDRVTGKAFRPYFVMLLGNPQDGYGFVGTFDSFEQADAWCDQERIELSQTWIAEVHSPAQAALEVHEHGKQERRLGRRAVPVKKTP